MADHSALMRAAAERDISHVRLGEAVAFIEKNMDPEAAAEAVSLIHSAICPGHAVARANGLVGREAEVVAPELEAAEEPQSTTDAEGAAADGDPPSQETKPPGDPKPKAPRTRKVAAKRSR